MVPISYCWLSKKDEELGNIKKVDQNAQKGPFFFQFSGLSVVTFFGVTQADPSADWVAQVVYYGLATNKDDGQKVEATLRRGWGVFHAGLEWLGKNPEGFLGS